MPESPDFAKEVIEAAQRGDRFAFTAAACRLGSLEDARTLVRERAVVRMVDRVAARSVVARPEDFAIQTRSARADESDGGPVMFGHFAVFNEWTEIDSWFEGHFLERIAPRAFVKTFRENRSTIKSLFQHGADPVAGDKPLGPIDDLREDDTGGYYEVPLLDAPYVREDILPGLREGLYGASFAFKVMREEFADDPDPSDDNPTGLPERTLKELRLYEFGPVTFPAYESATASVRSREERDEAPPQVSAETNGSHSDLGRRAARAMYTIERKEPSWQLP